MQIARSTDIVKLVLKRLAASLSMLFVAPAWAVWKTLFRGSDSAFASCSQLLSLLPGKAGSYVRVGFYRLAMSSCSPDCFIGFGSLFSQADTQIGKGAYIGPQCNVGRCEIGRDTLIASGVHIMSGTHQHRFDELQTPIRDQGGTFEKIRIGRDCWIGNATLVMANIGDHCVIGAGSVVTSDIPDYAIAMGNPARVVRSRKESSPEIHVG